MNIIDFLMKYPVGSNKEKEIKPSGNFKGFDPKLHLGTIRTEQPQKFKKLCDDMGIEPEDLYDEDRVWAEIKAKNCGGHGLPDKY